jgi:ubiquinone/menaquinone biosynthesis C-methylase UbiE
MPTATARTPKPYKGIAMEGVLASWYAKNTGNSEEFRREAEELAQGLRPGAVVLEIAPGPGYLAIELAKLGAFRITGLDISHSFVRVATENARAAGVDVEFRQGNASALPFAANWFDFIVCRAAFKNFGDPVGAIAEMHRVLRPGASALINDMRSDATEEGIRREVDKLNLSPMSRWFTRSALRSLKKRAYSRAEFERMIAATPFGKGEITGESIGFRVRLTKQASV